MPSRKITFVFLLQLLLTEFFSVVSGSLLTEFFSGVSSSAPSSDEVSSSAPPSDEEQVQVKIIFQNELPDPVLIFYEGDDTRVVQGEPLEGKGGKFAINTFPGHKFSYDFGSERHYVVAPAPLTDENKPILQTLLANRSEIGVRCHVSVGGREPEELNLRIVPWWAPVGASWFLALVRMGYYDGVALNRVVPHFLTQFGIAADYEVRTKWRTVTIADDEPLIEPILFQPGMLSFAGSGQDSRTTEIFVVMPDTSQHQLDYFGTNVWETPFGVVDNLDQTVAARWYSSYGDIPPTGNGPDPQKIYKEDGYEYLKTEFPDLDYIKRCYVVEISPEAKDEL